MQQISGKQKGVASGMGLFPIINILGRHAIWLIRELGGVAIFFMQSLLFILRRPCQCKKITEQVYFIGVKSLLIISLIGLFTGMVLGLQGYYSLVKFGSEGMLGAVVTLSLVRELGPVLSALMLVGRAGSSMAAELGIMRISEQIDALDTMDINPVSFLVSPRLAGALISFPLLNAIFIIVGIAGGFMTGVLLLGVNPGIFFARIYSSLSMPDITQCFIKSVVFAAIVATISCYQGFFTHMRQGGFGARGVSLATTSAVVISSVVVLCADYVITSVLM